MTPLIDENTFTVSRFPTREQLEEGISHLPGGATASERLPRRTLIIALGALHVVPVFIWIFIFDA